MLIPRGKRPGFTLLEMVLAAAIGALLMLALYAVLDGQLRHVDAGREVMEESTLARAILARIGHDISASLGPLPPAPPAAAAASGSTSATATSGQATAGSSSAVQFNLGVQGELDHLVLFVSRVPAELYSRTGAEPGIVADQRRITYWLVPGAGAGTGLARQEVKLVTSDDALATPDAAEEADAIIAEEVKTLEFRYFDGMAWQESWDGTAPGPDGMNPVGPPLAIEIRIGVAPGGRRQLTNAIDGLEPTLKYYRHVVAISAANGIVSTEP